MPEEVTKENVQNILKGVKHPAIDLSLMELGMVKSVNVEDGAVKIILAFPFPNIPIADQLVNSVLGPLKEKGIEATTEITTMSQEEVQHFLSLETANWKG